MKIKKSHELRWLFLREFTRHLILNSISEEEREKIQEQTREHQPLKHQTNHHKKIGFSPKPMQRQMQRPMAYKQSSMPGMESSDLAKINQFLADPRVQQIECNGPEKEILLKIAGNTQTTRIKLTKEEIDKIIKNFSEKTRIPLMKGVFKAAIGNTILTAVISDFVDTRFTIQKRSPF